MSSAQPALSLIIPVFSSQKTLFECLDACKESLQRVAPEQTQVIIVDDASEDMSAAIAQEFCQENAGELCNCELLFVQHKENLGAIAARHSGVREASAELLVFLDSDVVIGPDVLSRVLQYFAENENVSAISGNPRDAASGSFATRYKSTYMRFILGLWKEKAAFLYGSFFALRKPVYRRVEESYRGIEDDALGRALAEEGHDLRILQDLDICHLREYSYASLLKNDFKVSRSYAFLFVDTRGWRNLFSSGFSHAPRTQLLSVICAASSLPLLVAMLIPSSLKEVLCICLALILLLWALLNTAFLNAIRIKHGWAFTCFSLIHTFIDHVVMSLGILSGIVSRLTRGTTKS